jgi:hypothetical protein
MAGATELIIERNLPLVIANKPQKNQLTQAFVL